MWTLGTHFDELLENTQPPQARLDAARDLPPLVRDYLQEHKSFVTLAPHSRLAGSYAQDLCVGDVKDVDFLVRIPGEPEENEPRAKQLLHDLRAVLDDLPDALGLHGGAAVDIQGARRSVHVYFEGYDFHLDVVPCIAPNGFEQKLYVPDRGFNKWIPSHPIGYVKLLSELNKEHGDKARPLIRLLKHFRDYQMKARKPKSYWLGSLVVHHLQVKDSLDTTQPLAVIFRDLLNAIHEQYDHLLHTSDSATPNIPDPMLGHNISWNWSRTHFETFMRRLNEGRRWASNALESDSREEAVTWWQKVFGEHFFPSEVHEAALRQAAQAMPGQAFVTGSGLVSDQRTVGRSTLSRRTTFHGKTKG